MIEALSSLYVPSYAVSLVYMLQSTEYHIWPYLKWYWRTQNFAHVAKRRTLERTMVAKQLLVCLWLGMLLQILAGLGLIYMWYAHHLSGGLQFGLALLIGYPVVWAHLIILPTLLGRLLIIKPQTKRRIDASERIFKKHKGIKIAVAGSYGKTSMKELLLTVLSAGKNVKATPANKNVPLSHVEFAKSLRGDEDVLIIEYGEGAPGDVERFARTTHPTHGIITGLAPAHLDRYKTIEAAGRDIFSLADYLKHKQVYVNGDSPAVQPFITKTDERYDAKGALGWRVSNVRLSLEGTSFTLKKGKRSLKLKSGLLGRHQLGPLTLSVVLADQFGLTSRQITTGISQTMPFEHRMQPYLLNGGWVIDDTYNGNLEGIRAGTALLAELPGKRKTYVTPGLVDQGKETQAVHFEVGRLIAVAKPDMVVLMQNSVCEHIKLGLAEAGYSGELRIEADPLFFYSNLAEFIAVGDVLLMQNDWTDNYH